MTARDFHNVYRELIDENPLAIRAVLKVLCVEFTDTVPTLAVTCEARPRLLVNLAFVRAHCRTEAHVKALICHEFLHVLLRHTERLTALTRPEHLAVDAVINAIIHRSLGPEYSGMMSRYYADERGVARLLRPPTDDEQSAHEPHLLRALARRAPRKSACCPRGRASTTGNSSPTTFAISRATSSSRTTARSSPCWATTRTWRAGHPAPTHADGPVGRRAGHGTQGHERFGRLPQPRRDGEWVPRPTAMRCGPPTPPWTDGDGRRLPSCGVTCSPTRGPSRASLQSRSFALPVLSPGDRRAALRSLWSPFLPDARWETEHTARAGSAHVYLDVSGSMNAEMPLIVALLGRLTPYIRRPFWAFSNVVAPARIEQGRLIADTTGGTSMGCVLDHVARTKPRAAIVVTDGYIEAAQPDPGCRHGRHAPARHHHARRQRHAAANAPVCPTPNSRGCRHDSDE